jgi:hypothetical protein
VATNWLRKTPLQAGTDGKITALVATTMNGFTWLRIGDSVK